MKPVQAASVTREVVLEAPRHEVWRALTEAEKLQEWFANEVELDPRPGGAGVFRWGDGSARWATVETVELERRLGFQWREETGTASTAVEITLEDDAGGTRVRVTESLPRASASQALVGEWSWGIELLAALPRLRRLVLA